MWVLLQIPLSQNYWNQHLKYIRNNSIYSFGLVLETGSHHVTLDGLEVALQTECATTPLLEFISLTKSFWYRKSKYQGKPYDGSFVLFFLIQSHYVACDGFESASSCVCLSSGGIPGVHRLVWHNVAVFIITLDILLTQIHVV